MPITLANITALMNREVFMSRSFVIIIYRQEEIPLIFLVPSINNITDIDREPELTCEV
ncbi:MAG: hypothetical protein PVH04_07715 [Gammaproteobacteria bacterium]|jgi:hypothetical protein